MIACKMYVVILSITLCEKILLRIFQCDIKVHRSSCKVPVILDRF